MVARVKKPIRKKSLKGRKARKKPIAVRAKKARKSKLLLLEEAGLIGCLTDRGVTSINYKDILYKD